MMDSSAPNQVNKPRKKVFASRRSGVGTGTTSLLMIFTVLCFATLALLSLSTAASNRRIQHRGQQSASSFAAAQGVAAAKMAQVDAVLAELQTQKLTETEYFETALTKLKELDCTPGAADNTAQFLLPIDRYNSLEVVFQINPPEDKNRFTLLQQASKRIGDWEPEPNGSYWAGP